jgi:hypothetical protein
MPFRGDDDDGTNALRHGRSVQISSFRRSGEARSERSSSSSAPSRRIFIATAGTVPLDRCPHCHSRDRHRDGHYDVPCYRQDSRAERGARVAAHRIVIPANEYVTTTPISSHIVQTRSHPSLTSRPPPRFVSLHQFGSPGQSATRQRPAIASADVG